MTSEIGSTEGILRGEGIPLVEMQEADIHYVVEFSSDDLGNSSLAVL